MATAYSGMTSECRSEILIIDDEPQVRLVLNRVLEGAGYAVREAAEGRVALGEVALRVPDAIILDLGLPDISGFQVLQALRSFTQLPIIILSGFGDEDTKVKALNGGADDYVCKPFGTAELLARLQVMLRRTVPAAADPVVRLGSLEINLSLQWVCRDGRQIKLTATEFRLLQMLVADLDRVVTHERILQELWGPSAANRIHYVRTYMGRLRIKLGADFTDFLHSESGVGYRLVSRPEPPRSRTLPVTEA
ncbi:MAG TPA: response regulator transcription factor [Opitutaceae bacterium]